VKVGTDAKADLFYGSDRRGLALWNILSDAGKSVALVNWLVTYPPELINGVIVTDHALAGSSRARSISAICSRRPRERNWHRFRVPRREPVPCIRSSGRSAHSHRLTRKRSSPASPALSRHFS